MSNEQAPNWFRTLVAAAVVWNLMGVAAYIMDVTMNEQALQALTDAERSLRNATPAWVTGAYAIAVFAGLAGAIALAARRTVAVPLFGISLVAVVVQMSYVFIAMNAGAVLGGTAMIFPAVIILIGVFLLWFSLHAKSKGWLR